MSQILQIVLDNKYYISYIPEGPGKEVKTMAIPRISKEEWDPTIFDRNKARLNPDYGKGQKLRDDIEAFLRQLCDFEKLDLTAPPHDLASAIVLHLKPRPEP